MVKCNLRVLMIERYLKISQVAEDTGISRTTLTSLWYNRAKGIQFTTLETLCKYFEIAPDSLISIVPDQSKKGQGKMELLCNKCKDCINRDIPNGCDKCPAPMFSEVANEVLEEDKKKLEFIRKQESIAISFNRANKATRANLRKRNQSGIRYY